MGTAEVAALLGGVSRQRVLQLAQQAGFPEPIAVLSMGKVWDSDDVRRWAAEHRRQGTP
jgi:predicted DNA-binding transcriptional regulator AlpA